MNLITTRKSSVLTTGALLAVTAATLLAHGHDPREAKRYLENASARRQGSANPTLTNYAVGLAQDLQSALAEFLAPTVEVPSTIGQYKRFDDKNAFQIYETARPIGGRANRIEFEASDPTYNCLPQALEVPVDDAERDAADAADPIRLDESKVKTLVSSTVLSHEVKVVDKVMTNAPVAAGVGNWSDPNVDPVDQLDGIIEQGTTDCGMLFNRMAIGIGMWRVLRNHPKVIARQPGAANVGVTTAQFAQMLLNPAIDIRVGILSKDTSKFGKGVVKQNIVGGKALLFIGSSVPTQYDPSFAKTFSGRRGGITEVWSYREPRAEIHAVDWSEDIQITGNLCGKAVVLS